MKGSSGSGENDKFRLERKKKTKAFLPKCFLHLDGVTLSNKSSAAWFTFRLFGETWVATERDVSRLPITETLFVWRFLWNIPSFSIQGAPSSSAVTLLLSKVSEQFRFNVRPYLRVPLRPWKACFKFGFGPGPLLTGQLRSAPKLGLRDLKTQLAVRRSNKHQHWNAEMICTAAAF